MIKTKKCKNQNCCNFDIEQPIENFYKKSKNKDGYDNYCIECRRKRKRELYRINAEKIRERSKEWVKNNKDKVVKTQKKWRESNKDKKLEANKKWLYEPVKNTTTRAKQISKYEETRIDPNNIELLQVRCFNSNCREWFNPTNSELSCRINSINGKMVGENHFYCSDKCKKSCPIYGFKPTKMKNDENELCKRDKNIQSQIRSIVLEEDNNICQLCGIDRNKDPNIKLICHHIIPFSRNQLMLADIDNCITLCSDCHNKIHSTPGCTRVDLMKK